MNLEKIGLYLLSRTMQDLDETGGEILQVAKKGVRRLQASWQELEDERTRVNRAKFVAGIVDDLNEQIENLAQNASRKTKEQQAFEALRDFLEKRYLQEDDAKSAVEPVNEDLLNRDSEKGVAKKNPAVR